MGPNQSRVRTVANLGLIASVLALAGFAVFEVLGRQWRVQETFEIRADFDQVPVGFRFVAPEFG